MDKLGTESDARKEMLFEYFSNRVACFLHWFKTLFQNSLSQFSSIILRTGFHSVPALKLNIIA